VTSIIVSHDSTFLDFVCTHILHYESRKLRAYRGNLSEFVKQASAGVSVLQVCSLAATNVQSTTVLEALQL
jgi:elongation factor 3